MVSIVQKLIGKLKNDPQYQINSSYSSKQLLYILYYRFRQLCRGLFLKISISSEGLVFCGKGVTVEHGYQFKVGRNCILGENVQINALSENGVMFKNNVTIGQDSVLNCTGVVSSKGIGIKIGSFSAVGAQSFLGGQGGIQIGDDVIMGPQVKIFSENHNFDKTDFPIRKQGERRKGVSIGNNCWIGAGVIILDGVTIGNGCVIAAGAVVTRSLPDNIIAAGIPAKQLKSRTKI
jgi:acetyltransferase-like isoleucine patch superfamily enzyme